LENNKGEKNGTVKSEIEENPKASTSNALAEFLPLEKEKSPV